MRMSLFKMSLSGAVIILAVLIVRALFINRLPKKTFVILWEIVLVRLLLPFTVPSVFSVYTLANRSISTAVSDKPKAGDLVSATMQALEQPPESLCLVCNLVCWNDSMCVIFCHRLSALPGGISDCIACQSSLCSEMAPKADGKAQALHTAVGQNIHTADVWHMASCNLNAKRYRLGEFESVTVYSLS